MKINREDVVRAALTVSHWCKEHRKLGFKKCDCPFSDDELCFLNNAPPPYAWALEVFLRTRGSEKKEEE